ncbi:MAG: DNA-directed DNA polymerase III PolC [Patescibacteria group bacterium]|jgi:DNA-directed DNA polymerase III PolC
MYINNHTYFSLRYGTMSAETLVKAASGLGIEVLALTDINNTSTAYAFIHFCKKHKIKPVLGIEFRKEGKLLYIGLAKNLNGWKSLNRLLTDCSLDGIPLPSRAPKMDDVFLIYADPPEEIHKLRNNEFMGIRPGVVNALFTHPWKKYPDKLVAWSPVTFLKPEGYKVHQLLQAIDQNALITKLDKTNIAKETEQLFSPEILRKQYALFPFLTANAEALLNSCTIDLLPDFGNNKKSFTGSKISDLELLKKLAINGCEKRYGDGNLAAMERVQKELKVIDIMKFAPYFLITWDLIRYAQTAGYHHVGRGSGANSIVAFCLYITDVDPQELDLYFERFINPYRTSPPDFDIDFSWDERDDVIDYIFKRYGREHTALLATYNTFKGKSIIRELGKVFGLPKGEIDMIVNEPLAKEKHHAYAKHIFRFGKLIEGFPNYLSIHAGGILITEEPINNFTALTLMPKGFPITHFDMYGAEDLCLHKFDILSQRGLGHIKEAVALVKKNRKISVDIHDVEMIKNDERVKTQLRNGHCIGCFYIESPAMRGLLTKLACDTYVHLVAASSIIRPGVAKSGMMREYINRFHKPESFEYLHPVFKDHLGETFGVMVYQEDVMKICHHFSGLNLDESDVLRRMMSGKKKSSDDFERLRKKYFDNCESKGHSRELSEEVWRQIESFSGYSFCKAHSASYAVESFQSLYLKTYYPLEFMVAVINNFGGFYRTEVYVHEARMSGGTIYAPCVNNSLYTTTLKGSDVYIGFVHLHQLERRVAHQIVFIRSSGRFTTLGDFLQRVDISGDQLDILIRIGAFRFTGMTKYELMWEKNMVFDPQRKREASALLFEEDLYESFTLPQLEEGRYDQAFDEMELLGFPLCTPFDLVAAGEERPHEPEVRVKQPSPYPKITAAQLKDFKNKTIEIQGYYVARKPVTTSNGKRMNFCTWLDTEGRFFDTVHFPPSLAKYPFTGPGCYLMYGKVVLDFDFPSVEVRFMKRLGYVVDER